MNESDGAPSTTPPPPPPTFSVHVAARLGPISCFNVTLQFDSVPSVDDILEASRGHYELIAEFCSGDFRIKEVFVFDGILERWVKLFNMSQLSPGIQLLTWEAKGGLDETVEEIPSSTEHVVCSSNNQNSERAVQLVSDLGEPTTQNDRRLRVELREMELRHFKSVLDLVESRQKYITALENSRRDKLNKERYEKHFEKESNRPSSESRTQESDTNASTTSRPADADIGEDHVSWSCLRFLRR